MCAKKRGKLRGELKIINFTVVFISKFCFPLFQFIHNYWNFAQRKFTLERKAIDFLKQA